MTQYILLSLLAAITISCQNTNNRRLGKNDIAIDGLYGDVKKITISYYGYKQASEYSESEIKTIIYEEIPIEVAFSVYDKYGRIIERFIVEDYNSDSDIFKYGDYAVPETDAIIKNVLLTITTKDNQYIEYHYNDNGQLMKIISYSKYNKSNCNYIGNVSYINEKIDKIEIVKDSQWDNFQYYNILKKNYYPPSEKEYYIKYKYSKEGKLTSEEVYNNQNTLIEQRKYLYEKGGELKSIASTSKIEENKEERAVSKIFEYDSSGNWIKGVDGNGYLTYREIEYYN